MDVPIEWTGRLTIMIVWEIIGRQSVEHAAEVWWSGGHSICKKLESAQMRVGQAIQ